jgi:hypothetical protein
MMTSSLLHDGDLAYEREDLARLEAHPFRDAPAAMFLVKTGHGYRYGKPFLYPVLAVPFVALLGERGFLVLNLLCFLAAASVAVLFLRHRGGLSSVLALVAVVFGLSVFHAYVLWIHPDMMSAALLAVAFFLALGGGNPGARRDAAAAAVFGVAALAKTVNALYAVPWLVLLAGRGRPLRALAAAAIISAAASAPAILGRAGIEGASPYGGERYVYFDGRNVPFRAGVDAAVEPGLRVPEESQTFSHRSLEYTSVKLLGILAGRISGLLPHFFPIVLLFAAIRRFDGRKAALLASMGLFLLFTLVFRSDYFGGPALGNRYFHLYPAAVLLVDRVRWGLKQIALAAVALLLGATFLVNPLAHSLFPMTHTARAPFAWFHPEPTAVEDFYYVTRDFPPSATAEAVMHGLLKPGAAPSGEGMRFTSFERREVFWGPGVSTFALGAEMVSVVSPGTGQPGILFGPGRMDLFVRIANAGVPESEPVPVTFVFESAEKGGPVEVTVRGGGDTVRGGIARVRETAEARLLPRHALRYLSAHRTPQSVYTPLRDRVRLVRARIEADGSVILKEVRAPASDDPS